MTCPLCGDLFRVENGRELPSPFGQYLVAALRGENLLDDETERGIRTWMPPFEITQLLLMRRVIWPRGHMMGDNRARFSNAVENMIARAVKLRASGQMQLI